MKTQPRQHISNKYNTCTVVTSPVYIGSKEKSEKGQMTIEPGIERRKTERDKFILPIILVIQIMTPVSVGP